MDGQRENDRRRERKRGEEEDGLCPVNGCQCVLGWAHRGDADVGDPGSSTPLYSKEPWPCS